MCSKAANSSVKYTTPHQLFDDSHSTSILSTSNSDSLLATFDGINEPAAFFDLPTVALLA
jgi:hypothetical protein